MVLEDLWYLCSAEMNGTAKGDTLAFISFAGLFPFVYINHSKSLGVGPESWQRQTACL